VQQCTHVAACTLTEYVDRYVKTDHCDKLLKMKLLALTRGLALELKVLQRLSTEGARTRS